MYLLDNRAELPGEVESADSEVKRFIRRPWETLLTNPSLPEAIEAALGFGTARERGKGNAVPHEQPSKEQRVRIPWTLASHHPRCV